MTTTLEVLEDLKANGPSTTTAIAARLGTEAKQLTSAVQRADAKGLVRRDGYAQRDGSRGGRPQPIWALTDGLGWAAVAGLGDEPHSNGGFFKPHHGENGMRQRRRKAVGEPQTLDFADLKAVLGAAQARDILKMIELARVKPIVLDEKQISNAQLIVSGAKVNPQSMLRMAPLFTKFFAENPASKRTFVAWLEALSQPVESEILQGDPE